MKNLIMIAAATLLLTGPLPARAAHSGPSPADCDQIRQAVATYGYSAARRYALIHYGKDAVRYGDRCLARKHA
jgi:hypothetical protein